jgi:DNA-binding transcriptional ArsR family regulator
LLYIARQMASRGRHDANDIFTALGHPVRRKILRRLLAEDAAISPLELADNLSEPLSGLSYHVRVLAECGAIKLVRTRQIRGSTQHFYRASVKADWARSALATTKERRKKGRARGEEKG